MALPEPINQMVAVVGFDAEHFAVQGGYGAADSRKLIDNFGWYADARLCSDTPCFAVPTLNTKPRHVPLGHRLMVAPDEEMAMGIGSGDRREDDAGRTGSALGDLWRALSEGLLAALRDAVRAALGSSIGAAMARLQLRRRVTALFSQAQNQSARILTQQVQQAVQRSDAELRADYPDRPLRPTPPGVPQHMVLTMRRQLALVQVQAERAIDDAFKTAIGSVMSPRPGISQEQRWENAQKVLNDLADQGITGFVDKAGRRWELASYVEMATRTAVSRSLLNVQLTAYTGMGADAVLIVSRTLDAPCPRCRPWENKVLSITGKTVGQELTVTPFGMPERADKVVGTLPEAMTAGLFHPSCRHAAVAYIDGAAMTPPDLQPKPAAVYEAEQRQRALERSVREHRRRAAAALPGQKASAKRRLAAATKASREHAAAHGIKRRTRRERIDVPR